MEPRDYIRRIVEADYKRIYGDFERVVCRRIPNHHDAEDAISMAFHNIIKYSDSYRGSCHGTWEKNIDFRRWAMRVLANAKNYVLSRHERERILLNNFSLEQRKDYLDGLSGKNPEREAILFEENAVANRQYSFFVQLFSAALEGVPKNQMRLLEKRLEGKSYESIADEVGGTRNSLKVSFHRMRKGLFEKVREALSLCG